ncbi:MAG: hypothetical protein Q9157_002157 [Trypethelium eluteriae]
MASSSHVLLFRHEHTDLLGAMHDLNVRSKTRPQLQTFLTAASAVVYRQTLAFDSPERSSIGAFEDLVELAERHTSEHRQNVVADIVILTTIQIGQLVVLAEDHPSILSTRVDETLLPVGFGVGLIAAAIAATASNVGAVVTLRLRGVAVAFNLAIDLQRMGKDIEDSDGPWARVVSGSNLIELDQRLEKINCTLRPLQRAYIGQVLPESVVVFGPPSTLDAFGRTPAFQQSIPSAPAPSRCPMYGSHLPPVDPAKILGVSPVPDAYTVQRPLYSAHSPAGSPSDRTYGEMLRLIVAEIAHKPMQIEETVRSVAAALQKTGSSNVVLTTIGSTWDASIVRSILQKHGQGLHLTESPTCPKPSGDDVSSLPPNPIAVVGMSARFPESDALDEL